MTQKTIDIFGQPAAEQGVESDTSVQMQYLSGLNPPQIEAVKTVEGPVLVLAGAGSGKTKTLTARIAHLLCADKAWPSQILAVTFTNRAALEMRRRVERMASLKTAGLPWLGTFHSICVRILRRHAELAGLNQHFTILDSDDQIRLLKQLIKAADIDEKRWPARHLGGVIEAWKNRCLLPDEVHERDKHLFNGKGWKLYELYQARLKQLNAVDFGDLIMHVVNIFRSREDLLGEYQRRFKYILVDEYQDTNTAQYLWLKLLAGSDGNICCVGDDDQSIYGWRGAVVENILRFERSFPGARVIRLEQNYRSTAHILAAASAIISNNAGRLGKTLWTDLRGGEKVRVIGHADGRSEASWITQEIEALVAGIGRRAKRSYDDCAVLVRASFQMREIEDRFLALGIPYRVIGGPRFYERREIRDALAYLRLAVSSEDDLAFDRIVNTPRRGVGEKAQVLIQIEARDSQSSLMAAAESLLSKNKFPARTASGIRTLLANIRNWQALVTAGKMPLTDLVGRIIDESGLSEMWKNQKTPEAEGRIENLKELVKGMSEFDNLQGFLEHVALVFENLEDQNADKVSIMTLHAAKGQEFPAVFLPGWEEDVFPSRRAVEDQDRGLEEERRLAYVGITRAMEDCYVSFAATRFQFGEQSAQHTSRFVDELPSAHVEVLTPPGLFGSYRAAGRRADFAGGQVSLGGQPGGYNSPGFRRLEQRAWSMTQGSQPPKNAKKEEVKYSAGDRVFNLKFGYGEVIDVSDGKLQIEFDKSGSKHIVSKHVRKAKGDER